MKLAAVCFTPGGRRLCARLMEGLASDGDLCDGWAPEHLLASDGERMNGEERPGVSSLREPITDWAREMFETRDGLIFIGAAGIAVRASAPWIRDKAVDPAVLVLDEAGRFVIPLLSGHVGGANELAARIAGHIGAVPVITTATDVCGRFAVDVFAKRQGMELTDRQMAKAISADLLEDRPVGLFSDFPLTVEGVWPAGLIRGVACPKNIWISVRDPGEAGAVSGLPESEAGRVLRLVPRILVLGIGCRRGTGEETIACAVDRALTDAHIDPASVSAVATIALKKDEDGLRAYAVHRGLEFLYYTAEELNRLPGPFSGSCFVKEITGVDNVCERAAAAAVSGTGGRLLLNKQAADGVTVAAAVKQYEVRI